MGDAALLLGKVELGEDGLGGEAGLFSLALVGPLEFGSDFGEVVLDGGGLDEGHPFGGGKLLGVDEVQEAEAEGEEGREEMGLAGGEDGDRSSLGHLFGIYLVFLGASTDFVWILIGYTNHT